MLRLPNLPVKFQKILTLKIKKALKEFYTQVLDVENQIMNSTDKLETDLIKGIIDYKDGVFTGKFSAQTTKILRRIGAKYKNGKFYLKDVPSKYLSAFAQGKILSDKIIGKILDNLTKISSERIAEKADVKEIVSSVIENLDKSITVKAQFDEQQLEQIREKYTKNFELHIKNWTEDEIKRLRIKVNQSYKDGQRAKEISDYIQKKFDVSERKADFIARQELRLITTEVKEMKATKAGLFRYIWKTMDDSRVRDDHAHLEGTEQRFDNPPIVDSKTGTRANAGQYFNCRCVSLIILE